MSDYTVSWKVGDKIKRKQFDNRNEAKKFCYDKMNKIKHEVEIYEKKTNTYLFVNQIKGGQLQAHAHKYPTYELPSNAEHFFKSFDTLYESEYED